MIKTLKRFLQLGHFFLKKFGFTIIKLNFFDSIICQRNLLLGLVISKSQENKNYIIGTTGIVFSKDRAFQLYMLLSSYQKKVSSPPPLLIIFCASDNAHLQAYKEAEEILGKENELFTFIEEKVSFNETLLSAINSINTKNMFFIVDDNVFISPLDGSLLGKIDTKKYILSLRLSPHCTYSYTTRSSHSLPYFRQSAVSGNIFEFNWHEQPNEWSYPYSLDGHLFPTAEIKILASIGSYKGPNSFENFLVSFNDFIISRRGLCFAQSIILNMPLNKVQKENKNFSGKLTPLQLLNFWKEGLTFDLESLDSHIPASPHEEHYLPLIRRNSV